MLSRIARLKSYAERRQGIALVIVLGILAALVIMAMGFATFMRTERVAARNFMQVARTRQLALGTLHTMVSKINHQYSWGQGMYPSFSAFRIPNGTDDNNISGQVTQDLIYGNETSGGTLFYLPFDIQSHPSINMVNTSGGRTTRNGVQTPWLDIKDNDGALLGVYSYVIANESGFIDLNYAGNVPYDAGNRNSASNLNLDVISTFRAGAAPVLQARARDMAYYSPVEVKYLRVGSASPWTGTPAYPNSTPFTSYSSFAQRYRVNGNNYTNRVYIGGTSSDLQRREPEIIQGFEEVFRLRGLPVNMAQDAYNNLLDYVDEDDAPASGDAFSFCAEAGPMINEIIMTNEIVQTSADEYSMRTSFAVELWYPFVGTPPRNPYNLNLDAGVFSPAGNQPFKATKTVSYGGPTDGTPVSDPGRFMVEAFTLPTITMTSDTGPPNMGGARALVRVSLDNGSGFVDKVGHLGGQANMISFMSGAFANPAIPNPKVSNVQVNDPRVNWAKNHWSDPQYGSPGTPGQINNIGFNPDPDGDGVPDHTLFVRNGRIVNTGELGFIGVGTNEWRSFRLTGNRPDRVLDVFSMHTNQIERGLVNLNSHKPEALAAALYGARSEAFPSDPGATTLDQANAMAVADDLVNARPANGWNGLYGIGTINWQSLLASNNENEMESVIRTSSDMMDVTGNTFTLILRVRAVKDRSPAGLQPNGTYEPATDATLGEQEMAALIWRDPTTKETRIPYVKWLSRYDDY